MLLRMVLVLMIGAERVQRHLIRLALGASLNLKPSFQPRFGGAFLTPSHVS
jgi:hypothetical protein